jgi:hypothetical protein
MFQIFYYVTIEHDKRLIMHIYKDKWSVREIKIKHKPLHVYEDKRPAWKRKKIKITDEFIINK